MKRAARLTLTAVSLFLVALPVLAASPDEAGDSNEVIGPLFKDLVGLFVVATILESALALLFQWRLYKEFFNGRAVKTLVMFGVAYAVVRLLCYDVFANVLSSVPGAGNGTAGAKELSEVLSACVLAGGSAAVNELFKALGLRSPVAATEDKPKPPADRAWLSVKVRRRKAVGDIALHVVHIDPSDPHLDPPVANELAGVVGIRKGFVERLKRVFIADPDRFPAYGGTTVQAGVVYRLFLEADERSEPGAGLVRTKREVYRGRFAGRAVVDFEVEF